MQSSILSAWWTDQSPVSFGRAQRFSANPIRGAINDEWPKANVSLHKTTTEYYLLGRDAVEPQG